MDNNLDMNDLDFNVSGQGEFHGNQNIILDETSQNSENNNKNENSINNNNINSDKNLREKPSSSLDGVINIPNSKDENINKKIDISENNEEPVKSTLDEPISTTLKRDLYVIVNKVKYVIVPKMNERKIEELYNWDLWGPLLFCFLYSIALSTGKIWVGGFVITFNERFLGAQIGVCQVLSLLGYGMFPTTVAGIIIGFGGITNIIVKLILVLIGLIWSILASLGFFSRMVEPDKKFLAIFPIFIFLFSLAMFSLNY